MKKINYANTIMLMISQHDYLGLAGQHETRKNSGTSDTNLGSMVWYAEITLYYDQHYNRVPALEYIILS